jgi:hypothetical protein
MRLYRNSNYIGGSVTSWTSTTQIVGTFNLNQATLGDYSVCVLPDGTEASKICGPTFTISDPNAVGSIYFESNPTGASAYLNNTLKGTTTFTLNNVTPGYYKVLLQKSGYETYTDTVTVVSGKTVSIYGKLVAVASDATTVVTTPTPYTPVPTVKRTTKPTPTPWPTDTPTQASPVGTLAIIGAIGLALIAVRKH